MARRSKWVVNCWLAAGLLLTALALYWLATGLLPAGNSRKSHLGRAYDRIDSGMTLAQVESIVGRRPDMPPDDSEVPDGVTSVLDQEAIFVPTPWKEEAAIASWRDNDKRLEVYDGGGRAGLLAKRFYCSPPGFSDDNFWQRVVDRPRGLLK
jgi:hypothetical protein